MHTWRTIRESLLPDEAFVLKLTSPSLPPTPHHIFVLIDGAALDTDAQLQACLASEHVDGPIFCR